MTTIHTMFYRVGTHPTIMTILHILLNHSMTFPCSPVIKPQFFKRRIMHFNSLLMQRVSLGLFVCVCFRIDIFLIILFIRGMCHDD